MRRFQFRLESFLALRRWKEREWEIALAKIVGECLLMEKRIEEITGQIGASFLSDFRRGGFVDVESMMRRELFVQRLKAERERTQEALDVKRIECEEVRKKYLEAAKERKVMDKLKERRQGEYNKAQLDEEFKSVDDMNTTAAARQRSQA